MELLPDFRDLLAEFDRAGVECVLVGGYAVAFHGHPRATKDLDLVLAGGGDNLERAAVALTRFGAPASIAAAVRTMGDSDVVWLGQEPARIDLIRTIDGVATEELAARAIATTIDGVPVAVVSLDDLIANKRSAARPQDLADADRLEQLRARARGA